MRTAIADTGIGIAPDNISKLFQPFVQIDGALNRQYSGKGLGLTIVKRIVELHGGQIGLASELGVGSCFVIDLPYPKSHQQLQHIAPIQSAASIETKSDQSTKSTLILLAEDNPANISTFNSYLTAKGYRITEAENGEQAIALVQFEPPDLILMDIQMPKWMGSRQLGTFAKILY